MLDSPRCSPCGFARRAWLVVFLVAGCASKEGPREAPLVKTPVSDVGDSTTLQTRSDAARPVRPGLHSGGYHGCLLDAAGGVSCWGHNEHGQLGDGTLEDRASLAHVEGLPPVASMALGFDQTCAIDRDGEAWCWGGYGEEGPRSRAGVTRPRVVAGVEAVTRLAVGKTAACALTESVEVWCWGEDRYRRFAGPQVGARPVRVDRVLGVHAVDVRASADDFCVLDKTGQVTCWGSELGDWDSPPPRSEATNEERERWRAAWGGPIVRASGIEGFVEHAHPICGWMGPEESRSWRCLTRDPRQRLLEAGAPVGPMRSTLKLAFSGTHGCWVDGGRVKCWGDGDDGQADASAVAALDDVVQVTVGRAHSCALREDGTVKCWGRALHFATGDESMAVQSAPSAAPPEAARRALDLRGVAGLQTENTGLPCALQASGTVRCLVGKRWAKVPRLRGVVELSNGDTHACARKADGTVHCWGEWYFGPYNHDAAKGDTLHVRRPRRIRLRARAIESWGETDCALVEDGSVHCWGRGWSSDLSPQLAVESRSWVDVAMSERWCCGLEASGRASCWAGIGDTDGEPEFELDDAIEVSVAGDRGCAVLRDGSARCWGDGPVGDGTWHRRAVPTQVVGLEGVTRVSTGVEHSCAMTKRDEVFCWGNNDHGQLGDGTTRTRLQPLELAGDLTAVGVSVFSWRPHRMTLASAAATLVWTEDGAVWMWGVSEL